MKTYCVVNYRDDGCPQTVYELIPCLTQMLVSKGYSRLVVQIGNGSTEPGEGVDGLTVEWFRLKSSIHEYMSNASLIISHGGECVCMHVIFEVLCCLQVLVVFLSHSHWESP